MFLTKKIYLNIKNNKYTVKSFVQSLLNDRVPFNFVWELDEGVDIFGVLIYLLILIFKWEKIFVKDMF